MRCAHELRLKADAAGRARADTARSGNDTMAAAELALSELRVAEGELAGWRGLAVGQLAVGALPMAGTELVPRI